MILLITPSVRVQECAQALEDATSEVAKVTGSLQQAALLLREEEYSAVVIDQALVELEPEESDLLLKHLGTAVPVYVNFSISGFRRVLRELRGAIERHRRERMAARQNAEQDLRNDLKGTVTALLLSCQMTLQIPGLPPTAQTKMQSVFELAQEVSGKLGIAD
jgi:hypothetical protein